MRKRRRTGRRERRSRGKKGPWEERFGGKGACGGNGGGRESCTGEGGGLGGGRAARGRCRAK